MAGPLAAHPPIAGAIGAEWARLARAGTWWTGPERVALAAEVRAARSCGLCAERKSALSPYAVEGSHDGDGQASLPEGAVDAVHRIVSDQGRLSGTWHDDVTGEIGVERLVELIGVIVTVTVADTYHRGLGLAPLALPEPEAGEPSRDRPAGAEVHSARVPTVVPDLAEGDVAELYDAARSPIGIPNIRRALTLVPAEAAGFQTTAELLYLPSEHITDITWGWPDLSRPQVELVAAAVSSENECFY